MQDRSNWLTATTLREDLPSGIDLIRDPALNKGTGFTEHERDALGLRGLVPPAVFDQETQLERSLHNLRRRSGDLEKYLYLASLADRNEQLFYRLVGDHLEDILPLIYTPTVGRACQVFGHIYRKPRGLFVSAHDRGHIVEVLRNWPYDSIRVIVVTDGGRILGLGDLGANGMGIPVGKLALYTACAGVHPEMCLPLVLDAGTDNAALLRDPTYIGLRERRLTGSEYDDFVQEFVDAVHVVFPDCLIQFEDFATRHAFDLLARYRDRICTFNDDIQGTGAVALAGLLSALRASDRTLSGQRLLFVGAGEAGIGIADAVVASMVEEGLTVDAARQRCWFMDSHGLVVDARRDLAAHKRRYAHGSDFIPDLLTAVTRLEPTILIGACGQPGTFTPHVLECMAHINERPIVLALSNPTSRAECTAEEAYRHTQGRAWFASGSPFAPVEVAGRTLVPGQGNNVYIFPGVGLGVIAARARHVTDEMFSAAAKTLVRHVSPETLNTGLIYPPMAGIRDVSLDIAVEVAAIAYRRGLAQAPEPDDLRASVASHQYDPRYRAYV